MILWEVTMEWANKGRLGNTTNVVFASDAISALKKAWEVEDAADLRDVKIRWLAPLACVVGIENSDRFCHEVKE